MAKLFRRKKALVPAPADVDIVGLMDKIQSQLDSLERKLDTLISQRPQGRSFGGRSFDRSRGHDRGRDDSFRQRSMTKVICAECGIECEVPFKPSSDRPVYCRDCFAKRKGGGSDSSGGENREFSPRKKPSFRRRK